MTDVADSGRLHRSWVVPASAVAFAILFVIGLGAAGAANDTMDKTADEILKNFQDNKATAIVSAYLLVLAGLAFLPVIWAVTQRVGAGLSPLGGQIAQWAGGLFVAMTLVAGVAFATLAGGVTFGSEDDPPVDLIRFIPQIGYGVLLIAGALSMALFLVTISLAGQRSGSIPRWFCIVGFIAAVAMLGGVFFLPLIALPIWAISAAVVLRSEPA